MSVLNAKVKSVLSGDTIILTPPNRPEQERSLNLAYVQSPRLSGAEPYGYQSREYLRTLLVGKPIRFKVLYDINGREFGDIMAPVFNSLVEKSLADGNCTLRDDADNKTGFDEVAADLVGAQNHAQAENKGLWNEKNATVVNTQSVAPDTGDKQYEAVIERVVAGDRIQVRALINKTSHFLGNCLIAGIRAPRSASPDSEAEPFGEQSKLFVSTRLLQRNVAVKFVAKSNTGVPIVSIIHPAGDIAQLLLENGLATIADWQSQMLGAAKMGGLRASEVKAKEAKLNLFKDAVQNQSKGKNYEAVVAKVVSPDTIVLRTPAGEQDVQLASVRAPRKNDPNQAPYVALAKEFVRSKFIGKKVIVKQEAVRPATEQFEERPLVTITYQDKNIAVPIVQNGWATVIRHRKDDDDRSPIWDELLELEQAAIAANKGMHSKKTPPADRVVQASENVTKARGFLKSLERHGKVSAVVEHITPGGRFRLSVPKENCEMAMVMAGIRVPKKNEPCGDLALDWVSQRLYQRDVHIQVQNVDKTGAFIGNLYLPGKGIPLSLALVKEGLAQVHEFSAQQSGYESELFEAEKEAQTAQVGVWKDYVEETAAPAPVAQQQQQQQQQPQARQYMDVRITDIGADGSISYRLKSGDATATKTLAELTSFNNAATNSASFKFQSNPRRNELVAVSKGGKFSRGKIINVERPNYTVQNLDTGKVESVNQQSLRPLPKQFQTPALAKQAQLSFIQTPPASYLEDYVEFLKEQLLDQLVVANLDNTTTTPESISLYTANSKGPNDTVNAHIVDEGFAFVKPELTWEKLAGWKPVLDALLDLEQDAKADRVGVWEYGDPRNID